MQIKHFKNGQLYPTAINTCLHTISCVTYGTLCSNRTCKWDPEGIRQATRQNNPHTIYRLLARFQQSKTLMPSPTHTQNKQKHTHTVNRETCINPLTSSCWRWAQAPLCAVWSCAALSSSPANTPRKSTFSLTTTHNKAKFSLRRLSLVAIRCGGPVGSWTRSRTSYSVWNTAW